MMNFYFKDLNQDIRYIEVINTYNLAYWIATDASHYVENESNISAFDLNKLINQFKLAIDKYEHANNLSLFLKGHHKEAANALRQFVQMCLSDLNFYSEDKKTDSESHEINLLSQLDYEKNFQANYLCYMSPNSYEYLTLKSYSHINQIAEDLLLIDVNTNSNKNLERAKNIVAGFNLAKKTINRAIQNQASFEGMVDEFKIRRDLIIDLVNQINGFNVKEPPSGAFYIFPEVSQLFGKTFDGHLVSNANDLSMLILEKAHVATVPGDAFGYPNCIRISYSASREQIKPLI